MAESIKDKVAIVGMGCNKWGELWDKDAMDLIDEACSEALNDAGVDIKDIEAAWLGTMCGGQQGAPQAPTGGLLAAALQLQYIPVTRVENACFTGAEALRGATFALIAKAYDLVLVCGVEKLKDSGFGGLGTMQASNWHPVYGTQGTAPGRYAMAATRYFTRYGLTPEEGKRLIGMISVKSHYSGARNPKAHLRREITIEQVVNAPMIAWPLGLFDCCGVTDGAAAAVLCRTEDAKSFRDDYITIKSFGVSIGPGWGKEDIRYDYTHWPETEYAAQYAYRDAGIKDPRQELSLAEIHDCFSISELIASESLDFWPKGGAKEFIEAGANCSPDFRSEVLKLCGYNEQEITSTNPAPEDVLPINHSGGLKSFGHPVGASGCREVYEFYKQYQGKAEEPSRQLKNVKLGLAHNQGGHPGRFMCGITITGAP
jgi:acetyl-CoA C-acetyltransferase